MSVSILQNSNDYDLKCKSLSAEKVSLSSAPVDDTDAATKKYVDDNSGGGGSASSLAQVLVVGNSANAKITNLTAPTADTDAATKKYVDDNSSAQNIDQVLTTGSDAGGESVTNLLNVEATGQYKLSDSIVK